MAGKDGKMTDIRKNLIILIFVLGGTLISLIFLNYQKINKNQKSQLMLEQSDAQINSPAKLSRGEVDFFSFKDAGRAVFYEKGDSTIYDIALDGKNKKALTKLPKASDIVFSPNGQKLIATVSGKRYLFDLTKNQKNDLTKNHQNAVFSPDSRKVAFYSPNEGSIWILNLEDSSSSTIFKTRIENLGLFWPQKDLIVFYPKDKGDSLFSITPDGNQFKKISQEEFNLYINGLSDELTKLNAFKIEAINLKLSDLKDYLLFVNARDGKLYSLRLE